MEGIFLNHTTKQTKNIRRSRTQWMDILFDFHQSGLSGPNYCEQNNIAYASFCKWRSLLKSGDKPNLNAETQPTTEAISFIELPRHDPNHQSRDWDVELEFGAGVVLRLRAS